METLASAKKVCHFSPSTDDFRPLCIGDEFTSHRQVMKGNAKPIGRDRSLELIETSSG
jgi:hypothetical protein